MTFRQFAANNVRRNFRSYLAYFLSSVFSVSIFFIYSAFIFHPEVVNGSIADGVRRGMIAAEVVIFAFAFFFVLYSMGAFLKMRKKEFGILTLLGITRGQLNWMIFLENTIIAVAAIAGGIGTGALLNKLFLMAFTEIMGLEAPLGFHLPEEAVVLTAVSFFILFELITVVTLFTIRSNKVIDLLQGTKKPKKQPAYSIILSIAAIAALIAGYAMAYDANIFEMTRRMLPILGLVIFGTYFLFTQLSIALIRLYQKKRKSYFRGTNLLTASDLAYKLKDNARILSAVAVLSAVTLTSTGVLANLYFGKKDEATARYPHEAALISQDTSAEYEEAADKMKQIFKKHGIAASDHDALLVPGVVLNLDSNANAFDLLSESDYNDLAELSGQEKISIPDGTVTFVQPTPDEGYEKIKQPTALIQSANGLKIELKMNKAIPQPIMTPSKYFNFALVVTDELYAKFRDGVPEQQIRRYHAFSYPKWDEESDVVDDLKSSITGSDTMEMRPRLDEFNEMKEFFSLLFFIGFFVSILFFIAAGSALYFRLYNEIDKDIIQYKALSKIGLTFEEMKKVVGTQIGILFFVPFFVAAIHSSFAYKAMQNMVSASILYSSMLVILSFFIIQVVYYFLIRSLYIKKIARAM